MYIIERECTNGKSYQNADSITDRREALNRARECWDYEGTAKVTIIVDGTKIKMEVRP